MGTSLRHYTVRCKYSVFDPSGALKLHEPLTPMSDQDRTSPNNINTISRRQVMRIKKISFGEY